MGSKTGHTAQGHWGLAGDLCWIVWEFGLSRLFLIGGNSCLLCEIWERIVKGSLSFFTKMNRIARKQNINPYEP